MNKFLCFALGVTTGALCTLYFCREHYRKIADEEIQSVIREFGESKKYRETGAQKEPDTALEESIQSGYESERQSKLQDYTAMIRDMDYDPLSPKDRLADELDPEDPPPGDEITKPYVIRPEEFDTIEGYEVIMLTYYANDILTDEDDEVLTVDEIAWSVGLDFAAHFGEYEDDSVHIRNDMRQTDYEILRVLQKFGE